MRTFLPLLLTIASVIPAISQVPDYLNNNPKWRVFLQLDSSYPCLEKHNYVEYVKGDTTIGSFSYKIIHKKGTINYQDFSGGSAPCGGPILYDWFQGWVRQDSMKVYRWTGSNDELLYDFNLQIGDTIHNWAVLNSDGWFVTSQDSLLINGIYHLRSHLRNDYMDSIYLLEGVGSSAGLFAQFPTFFEDDAHLICYSQNGTVEWEDTSLQMATCNFDVGMDEETDDLNLEVFPNPAANRVQIINHRAEAGDLWLLNVAGETIAGREIIPNQSLEIDLRALPNGLYFLRVHFDSGLTGTKRILILSE